MSRNGLLKAAALAAAFSSVAPAHAGSNVDAMDARSKRAFALPAEVLRSAGPIAEGAEIVFSARRLPDGTFSIDSLAVADRLPPADRAAVMRIVPYQADRADLLRPAAQSPSDHVPSDKAIPFGTPKADGPK